MGDNTSYEVFAEMKEENATLAQNEERTIEE